MFSARLSLLSPALSCSFIRRLWLLQDTLPPALQPASSRPRGTSPAAQPAPLSIAALQQQQQRQQQQHCQHPQQAAARDAVSKQPEQDVSRKRQRTASPEAQQQQASALQGQDAPGEQAQQSTAAGQAAAAAEAPQVLCRVYSKP